MAPAASTSALNHRILYYRPLYPALNIARTPTPAEAPNSHTAEPIAAISW
jgi:hypothetical protein